MGRLVFISYRRQRGYELAHLVNAELRSRGLRTFIDIAESDPGQFWAQAQRAIHSCHALVLICTNGSFEGKAGDDWVLREVSEAIALGRPIVPVFSQDFKLPGALPELLAQAMEYNGVSMDTQFHVAAFDHLSQLVGGRKRSAQRRRVAMFGSLVFLTLLASLALGAREIIGLTEEFRREREARQAANARSEKLAQDIAALEKSRADERRAAEQRQRQADVRSENLAENLAALERKGADGVRVADERERRARDQATKRERDAKYEAEQRRWHCTLGCESTRRNCESSCFQRLDGPAREACKDSCKQYEPFCKSNCQ
jgi:hypothetical protein